MQKLIAGAGQLGISLTQHQVHQFQTYYEELVAWNRRANLTAITGYEEVQVLHFLDSLSVLLVQPALRGPVIDVGAGAGFPGLPLKIACPDLRVTLLDSVGKKAAYLMHMVEVLGLEGVDVVTQRAEVAGRDPSLRETFACVLARGLAPMPTLLELTLPFCSMGGILISHKGGAAATEMARSERALALLGGRWRELVPVPLEGMNARALVVVEKVAPTAAGYPRRVGVPTRRPLT